MSEIKHISLDAKAYPIHSVSLYASRADIKRSFHDLKLQSGTNVIEVKHLPAIAADSLRINAYGNKALLGEVVLETSTVKSVELPELAKVEKEVKQINEAIARLKARSVTFNAFVKNANPQSTGLESFTKLLSAYEDDAKEVAEKVSALENELEQLAKTQSDLQDECNKTGDRLHALRHVAKMTIHTTEETTVGLDMTYAVDQARWRPLYTIRVDTQTTTEQAVKIKFQGEITQSSGEDWNNVEVVLETATPSFNSAPPVIDAQYLTFDAPRPVHVPSASIFSQSSGLFGAAPPPPPAARITRARTMQPEEPEVANVQTVFNTRGVSASYIVPGQQTIPSSGGIYAGGDRKARTVVIAESSLHAVLERICVPTLTTQAYLRASMKNTSAFMLLEGQASIYVDGSYVGKSTIPSVSADERFSANLGIDRTLEVVAHGLIKKSVQSGLVNRTKTLSFSQKYSIKNTGRLDIPRLLIYSRFPVTQNDKITLNRINPPLADPATLDLNIGNHYYRDQDRIGCKWSSSGTDEEENSLGGHEGKFLEHGLSQIFQVPITFGL